jgi:hypothetical protein
MPSHHRLNEDSYFLPRTLVKKYEIYADGTLVLSVDNNHQRLRRHALSLEASEIEVRLIETCGDEQKRIYAVDLY